MWDFVEAIDGCEDTCYSVGLLGDGLGLLGRVCFVHWIVSWDGHDGGESIE